MSFSSSRWLRTTKIPFVIAAALGLLVAAAPSAAACSKEEAAIRIDLRVLVLDDAQPMVRSIVAQLDREGVPYTTVDLADASRQTLTRDFLRAQDKDGPRAHFQAVVAPNHAPGQLAAGELAELYDLEQDFGIRQVSAYVWPDASVGLAPPGYSGPVDGAEGTLSREALASGFDYLSRSFSFDDFNPAVTESYGYVAAGAADLPAGSSWTPFVTTTIDGVEGSLLGVHTEGRREEMVLTYGQNEYQQHSAALSHGIVQWMTRGIHLGEYRNYYSIHVDDVFMADDMWNAEGNCTVGDNCDPVLYPEGAPGASVRMVAEDVTVAKNWQKTNGVLLDMAYNKIGYDEYLEETGAKKDPVFEAFRTSRKDFRWLNHTLNHINLGCDKDFSTIPWRCATDAQGNIAVQPLQFIRDEIGKNVTWGNSKGFSTDKRELVPGEHSGLAQAPQLPFDNPNFAPALEKQGVAWVASDASREMDQRASSKGSLTVPRYPMSVYYNTSTYATAVDEYNWIYTSRGNGGSGICEDMPEISTCIEPLDPATGFQDYITPLEVRTTLRHATTSDPRPHYVHQTNLTEDRILYPVLDGFLAEYNGLFNVKATPLVNPSLTKAGEAMARQAAWDIASGEVSASLIGTKIHVTGGSATVEVPVTAGPNTTKVNLQDSYANARSEWVKVTKKATKKISLSTKDSSYPMFQDLPTPVIGDVRDIAPRGVSPEATTVVPPFEARVETTPQWNRG